MKHHHLVIQRLGSSFLEFDSADAANICNNARDMVVGIDCAPFPCRARSSSVLSCPEDVVIPRRKLATCELAACQNALANGSHDRGVGARVQPALNEPRIWGCIAVVPDSRRSATTFENDLRTIGCVIAEDHMIGGLRGKTDGFLPGDPLVSRDDSVKTRIGRIFLREIGALKDDLLPGGQRLQRVEDSGNDRCYVIGIREVCVVEISDDHTIAGSKTKFSDGGQCLVANLGVGEVTG